MGGGEGGGGGGGEEGEGVGRVKDEVIDDGSRIKTHCQTIL